jgi:hypothetical protein
MSCQRGNIKDCLWIGSFLKKEERILSEAAFIPWFDHEAASEFPS